MLSLTLLRLHRRRQPPGFERPARPERRFSPNLFLSPFPEEKQTNRDSESEKDRKTPVVPRLKRPALMKLMNQFNRNKLSLHLIYAQRLF